MPLDSTVPPPTPWTAHVAAADTVLQTLGSCAATGLSEQEARARLLDYGPNRLNESPPQPLWRQLLEQCRELVVALLLAAAGIAAILGEWIDTAAILAIVVANALLGLFQQRKAERALATLQRLSAPLAKVVRGGIPRTVPAEDLVPGDRLELEAGDHIPADARLISGFGVQTLEAPLTGESAPVAKDPGGAVEASTPLGDRCNMVFQGCVVATGKATAVVVATGMHTELGKIAQLLAATSAEPTPLQKRLSILGQGLAAACLLLVTVIFALELARGSNWLETMHLAVSLAVAAIPEGLPAAVTITLTVGLERLVRRNAIVRKLSSVETLGSVSVICSDKTGTLTRNEMTVREVHTLGDPILVAGSGYGPHGRFSDLDGTPVLPPAHPAFQRVLQIAAWCNHARVVPHLEKEGHWQAIGDPTEAALVVLARKGGVEAESRGEIRYEIPFDSDRKLMSVLVASPGAATMLCTKGAPEVVLDRCQWALRGGQLVPLEMQDRQQLMATTRHLAARAMRVLALAYRTDVDEGQGLQLERDLVFAGLVGMIDPPRDEVREAVASCRAAGIRPIMITGDHPATALAIARELGIAATEDQTLTGSDLESLNQEELEARLQLVAVFARVSADHKVRIVRLLKAQGHVVGMTGDGVNDAPAVKAADIGIAMGVTGTDVTKQASNLILTDDNFATIVNAVEEGRGIFDNIQKFIYYLLAGNAGKIIFMLTAALAGWPNPLLPLQLLWLNLVTDGLPALGLGVERPEQSVMQRPPRSRSAPLIGWRNGVVIVAHGSLIAAAALAGFYIVYAGHPERLEEARVVSFCILAFAQLGYALTSRSRERTLVELGLLTNRWLLVAIGVSLLLQSAIVAIPWLHPIFGIESFPEMWEWGLILGLANAPWLSIEIGKLLFRRQPAPGQASHPEFEASRVGSQAISAGHLVHPAATFSAKH